MTIKEATEIVLGAATAQANGHSDCDRIMGAVEFMRAYMEDQDDGDRPAETRN